MGISLLELVQNRFPFPSDIGPIELMIHITSGEVNVITVQCRCCPLISDISLPDSRMNLDCRGVMI